MVFPKLISAEDTDITNRWTGKQAPDLMDALELHVARCEIRAQNWDQDVGHGVRSAA